MIYANQPDGTPAFIEPHGGRRFEINVPMCKSLEAGDGSIEMRGIATDERRDVDREIIKATQAPWNLDYLRKAGVFNWNHTHQIIGHLTDANWIDADGAQKRYGQSVEGTAIDIAGRVHPLTGIGDPAGLMEAHRLVKCKHPLFYSIQGTAGSKDAITGEVIPAFIHQIAITPQPKNTNCSAYSMAKSLAGMAQELAEARPESDHELPLVFIGKAIEATGIVPNGDTTGGDALKLQNGGSGSGSGGGSSTRRRCAKCGERDERGANARFCSDCGGTLIDTASTSASARGGDVVREFGKALGLFARPPRTANEALQYLHTHLGS